MSVTLLKKHEENRLVELKCFPTDIPLWNKELCKFRLEVRGQFKKARKTNLEKNWKKFRNFQRKYRKAVVIVKRKG